MDLDPTLVETIDARRREGADYSGIHREVVKIAGVSEGRAHRMLKTYMELPLPDGRPRGQVNLGAPEERGGPSPEPKLSRLVERKRT